MSTQNYPLVGNWYRALDGQLFEVIAFDEDDNSIEIQYFGGEIDEVDYDSWQGMVSEIADPPDDWTGPYDELERDDLGYSDIGFKPEMHSIPIEDLD